jgi:hypothetical protein
MLLDLFPLLLLILFLCFVHLVFWLLYDGGISFLVQSIWSSVDFLYGYGHIFLWIRKFFFYNFVEDIYWPFKLGIFIPFYTYLSLGLIFLLCSGFPGWFGLGAFCISQFLLLLCQCFLCYLLPLRFFLLSVVFCWWCLHLWLLIFSLGFYLQGCLCDFFFVFILFLILETGFLCVALAVLELTL